MCNSELPALLSELEADPASIQLHHGRLEPEIARCMDEVNELSLSGEDNNRKMKLVAFEYRASLVLERYRKLGAN